MLIEQKKQKRIIIVKERKADNSLFFNKYNHMNNRANVRKKRKVFIKK